MKRNVKELLSIDIEGLLVDAECIERPKSDSTGLISEANFLGKFRLKSKFYDVYDIMSASSHHLYFNCADIEGDLIKPLFDVLYEEYGKPYSASSSSNWDVRGYFLWFFKNASHELTENAYYDNYVYGIILFPPNSRNHFRSTLGIMRYNALENDLEANWNKVLARF